MAKKRREFLFYMTGAMGALGAAAIARPIVKSFSPAKHNGLPPDDGKTLDISQIPEGELHRENGFNGQVLFLRHRSPDEVKAARTGNGSGIYPERDDQRLLGYKGHINPNFQILDGRCTYFGCLTIVKAGDYDEEGGYFCPCCASHYDVSGRARKGPARTNLRVPNNVKFISPTTIWISKDHIVKMPF